MSNLMIAKRGSLQVTKWTPTESHSILPAMSLVSGIVHFQPDDSRWFLDFHGFPPLEIPSNFWFLGHPFYHILSIDNIYIYIYIYFKSFYPILSHGFQIMSSGSGIFTFFFTIFFGEGEDGFAKNGTMLVQVATCGGCGGCRSDVRHWLLIIYWREGDYYWY